MIRNKKREIYNRSIMKIELVLNSVKIEPQDMGANYCLIMDALKRSLSMKRKFKRRRSRKKKVVVGTLIDGIIDSLEK